MIFVRAIDPTGIFINLANDLSFSLMNTFINFLTDNLFSPWYFTRDFMKELQKMSDDFINTKVEYKNFSLDPGLREKLNSIEANTVDNELEKFQTILLHGRSGAGKTEFMKHLIQKLRTKFRRNKVFFLHGSALLKGDASSSLKFIDLLFKEIRSYVQKSGCFVLALDEVEELLSYDGEEKNGVLVSILAQLTNLASFSTTKECKGKFVFIATANYVKKFHEALARRFMDSCHFSKLSTETIMSIFKKSINEFKKKYKTDYKEKYFYKNSEENTEDLRKAILIDDFIQGGDIKQIISRLFCFQSEKKKKNIKLSTILKYMITNLQIRFLLARGEEKENARKLKLLWEHLNEVIAREKETADGDISYIKNILKDSHVI